MADELRRLNDTGIAQFADAHGRSKRTSTPAFA